MEQRYGADSWIRVASYNPTVDTCEWSHSSVCMHMCTVLPHILATDPQYH